MKTLLEIENGDKLYGMSLKYVDDDKYTKSFLQEVIVTKVLDIGGF